MKQNSREKNCILGLKEDAMEVVEVGTRLWKLKKDGLEGRCSDAKGKHCGLTNTTIL